MKYAFKYIENCNMCGSKSKKHTILGKRLNISQGRNPEKKVGITVTICKCNRCGLVYSNPQPVPSSLQDHYGSPPEDYWSSEYFEINENYFSAEIARLKKLMDFKPGMKSLDIGAGLGKQMIVLSKIGFDAYGIEPSEPFYSRAISQMKINPEKLKLGMIEQVDYPENNFDFISFGAVLEHLYDPSSSIRKAMVWLKPQGIIHIEVPSSNWLIGKLINLFYKVKLSDYVGNLSPMHKPFHLYEFSIKSFEMSNIDYEIAFHEYYVCRTYMPKSIDLILKPFMKKTNSGMQLCVWLRKK